VVEDLVKEVFLWVWTRADQWNGLGKVEGWIYRIATNLSLNHLRSVKRRPQQRFEMLANDIGDDEGISAPRASTSWRVPGELFVQGLSSHGLQPSVRWIRWWT
jgi:DNA-directed RNA polymerase specialized sigma24 family protein